MSLARALASYLVYPIVVGGSLVGTWALLGLGWPAPVVTGIACTAAGLVTALLEVLLPYRQEWRGSKGDFGIDVAYTATSSVASEVGRAVVILALTGLVAVLPRARLDLWPHAWPLAGQVALAAVLGELPSYWVHRIQHEYGGFLWRLHATHHSAPRLYWLNVLRNHPLDAFISGVTYLAPLYILGAHEDAIVLFGVFSIVHGFQQHSNVDARLGPLDWVLSTAAVHRWHHARALEDSNANYGQIVLVWDVLFRTRRVPAGREPSADTGLYAMPSFPMRLFGQLASPFRGELWRAPPAEKPPVAVV